MRQFFKTRFLFKTLFLCALSLCISEQISAEANSPDNSNDVKLPPPPTVTMPDPPPPMDRQKSSAAAKAAALGGAAMSNVMCMMMMSQAMEETDKTAKAIM